MPIVIVVIVLVLIGFIMQYWAAIIAFVILSLAIFLFMNRKKEVKDSSLNITLNQPFQPNYSNSYSSGSKPKFVRFNPFTGYEYTTLSQVSDFIALDFETANELPISICAAGITVVRNSTIVDSKHWYIRPRDIRFTNTHIHGISPDMVADSPLFDELWESTLREMVVNNIVVAYNASFDIGCLENTLLDYGVTGPQYAVIDALKTARDTWPNLNNHKLPTVSKHLRFPLDHHNAASDSIACANILLVAQQTYGHVPLLKCMRTQYPTPEINQALSTIYGATSDIAKYIPALSTIDSYLSNPFIDGKEKAQLHRKCGETYLGCNEKTNAIAHFEKALEYNPKVGVAMTLKKLKKELSIVPK